uniref:Biogenesis of lysosome-related organelles complex 1 subunit 1 n=1 Tax=Oncorhynchus mykiss TaxID=8022 RepID=A0A8K9UVK6_ONCMY
MLSRLLKEHHAKQNERKELQERRRREAIAAATCLTEALVDHLNVGVAQAYVNQRKLDHEVKTLQVQAGQFSKQTAQWIVMVEGFNQALKICSGRCLVSEHPETTMEWRDSHEHDGDPYKHIEVVLWKPKQGVKYVPPPKKKKIFPELSYIS